MTTEINTIKTELPDFDNYLPVEVFTPNHSSDYTAIIITNNHFKNIGKMVNLYFTSAEENKKLLEKTLAERELLLTSTSNLLRSKSFLQLTIQFLEGQISEDEFNSEIDKNPDKYIVELTDKNVSELLPIIHDVVEMINLKFSVDAVTDVDGVAELFSLDLNLLHTKFPKF